MLGGVLDFGLCKCNYAAVYVRPVARPVPISPLAKVSLNSIVPISPPKVIVAPLVTRPVETEVASTSLPIFKANLWFSSSMMVMGPLASSAVAAASLILSVTRETVSTVLAGTAP